MFQRSTNLVADAAGRENGAGEGNRTLVFSLGSCCSTIELHPHSAWQTLGTAHEIRSTLLWHLPGDQSEPRLRRGELCMKLRQAISGGEAARWAGLNGAQSPLT